jgi:hypothetical protein
VKNPPHIFSAPEPLRRTACLTPERKLFVSASNCQSPELSCRPLAHYLTVLWSMGVVRPKRNVEWRCAVETRHHCFLVKIGYRDSRAAHH